MPDQAATPAPAPKVNSAKGDVDKQILANIELGETVATAAADPDHAAALADEGVDAAAVTNLSTLNTAARDLAKQVVETKKLNLGTTKAEAKAHKTLLTALRGIQSRAKRKFAKDKPRQAAYGIGKKNFGHNRTELDQDAAAILKLAATDALTGLTPAKLAAANTAYSGWKQTFADQNKVAEAQAKAITDLAAKAGEINDARRDIQHAVETVWPPTDKANAAPRRAFKLAANKPMAK